MSNILKITAAAILLAGGPAFRQANGQVSAQTTGSAQVQDGGSNRQASASAATNSAAGQAGQDAFLAAGTTLNARLDESLDSKKAKAGDSFTAHTTEAVKANGKTLIPKGTKLMGHLTKASARSKGDADSALAVQFDRAILKDKKEIPLQVAIQALAAAPSVTPVGGSDLEPSGNAGAGPTGSAAGRGSAGGGAASRAENTIPRVATDATGTVNTAGGSVNSTGRTGGGLNAAGELTSTGRGVFGLDGLNLNSSATNGTEGSVVTSSGKSVHLDSGTQLLLVTQAPVTVSALPKAN